MSCSIEIFLRNEISLMIFIRKHSIRTNNFLHELFVVMCRGENMIYSHSIIFIYWDVVSNDSCRNRNIKVFRGYISIDIGIWNVNELLCERYIFIFVVLFIWFQCYNKKKVSESIPWMWAGRKRPPSLQLLFRCYKNILKLFWNNNYSVCCFCQGENAT